MNLKQVLIASSIVAVSFMACDDDDNDVDTSKTLNNTDRVFMTNANLSNNAEIGAANLAITKAESQAIKDFAQMMLTEHTTAQNDLKTLGTNVNYAITDSVDDAHKAMLDSLGTLEGRVFDSVYIRGQVADHQTAVGIYQAETGGGQHMDVKNYANLYLPKIQSHLQMADSLSTNLFP